ncbi:hypothetical protein [Vibrio cyclitrophicus]
MKWSVAYLALYCWLPMKHKTPLPYEVDNPSDVVLADSIKIGRRALVL